MLSKTVVGLCVLLSTIFNTYWISAPMKWTTAGQLENESSWNVHSTLKTSRELGRGLAQLTIAYNKNGSERFNSFKEALNSFKPLRNWNWKSDPYNVKYQMTYIVLKDKVNYEKISKIFIHSSSEIWRGALVSYNSGYGLILKRRFVAHIQKIPDNRWTNGLDHAFSSPKSVLLYGKSLNDTINQYPIRVFQRAKKYQRLFNK